MVYYNDTTRKSPQLYDEKNERRRSQRLYEI